MPIDFFCTSCQQQLRVEDSQASQEVACPTCRSRQIAPAVAGQAPTPLAPVEATANPFVSPAAGESDYGSVTPRSGPVTAVAVVNFVLGGLQMSCGVLIGGMAVFMGDFVREAIEKAVEQAPNAADLDKIGDLLMPVVAVMAGIAFCIGIVLIIAGFGVLRRKAWGRILTLVTGGILGLFGLCSCVLLDPTGLVNLGYGVFVYIVLLKPQYAAEFR